MRKKTHEEFVKEVYNLVSDEYTVLGLYTGNKNEVIIRHNNESCNYYEKPVKPNHFLRGRRCRVCSQRAKADKLRKPHDIFVQEVYSLIGNDYTILGTYHNSMTGVLTRHNLCGYEWSPRPNDFINNSRRCPRCYGNQLKDTGIFKMEVYELVGDEYSVLGEYVSTHVYIKMRHNSPSCNYHEWDIEPNSFTSGKRRCPICSYAERGLKQRKSHEQFLKEVSELVGDEYAVLGQYDGNKRGVRIRHNSDSCKNHTWSPSPNGFLRGIRCPKCQHSRGEKRISEFLDSINVKYIRQYRYEDCRNKKPLPFDFAILNDDSTVSLLIEYDGELHFKKGGYRNAREKLKATQRHDAIKNDYCIDKKIDLIRIPYWEFDKIEDIITKRLGGSLNHE